MDRKLKVWLESKARPVGEPLIVGFYNSGDTDIYNISFVLLDIDEKPISDRIFVEKVHSQRFQFEYVKNVKLQEGDSNEDHHYVIVPIIIEVRFQDGSIKKRKTFFRLIINKNIPPKFLFLSPSGDHVYIPKIRDYEKLKEKLAKYNLVWIAGGKFMGKTEFVKRLEKFMGGKWLIYSKELIESWFYENKALDFSENEIENIVIDDMDEVVRNLLREENGKNFIKNLINKLIELSGYKKVLLTTKRLDYPFFRDLGLTNIIQNNFIWLSPLEEEEVLRIMEEAPVFFDESLVSSMPELTDEDFSLKSKKYFYYEGNRFFAEDLAVLFEIYSKFKVVVLYVETKESSDRELEVDSLIYFVSKFNEEKKRKVFVVFTTDSQGFKNKFGNKYDKLIFIQPRNKPIDVDFDKNTENHVENLIYKVIGSNPYLAVSLKNELYIKHQWSAIMIDRLFSIIFEYLTTYEDIILKTVRELTFLEMFTLLSVYERLKIRVDHHLPDDMLDILWTSGENINIYIYDMIKPLPLSEVGFLYLKDDSNRKIIVHLLRSEETQHIVNILYDLAYGELRGKITGLTRFLENKIPKYFKTNRFSREKKLEAILYDFISGDFYAFIRFVDSLISGLKTLRESFGGVDDKVFKESVSGLKNKGLLLSLDDKVILPYLFQVFFLKYRGKLV